MFWLAEFYFRVKEKVLNLNVNLNNPFKRLGLFLSILVSLFLYFYLPYVYYGSEAIGVVLAIPIMLAMTCYIWIIPFILLWMLISWVLTGEADVNPDDTFKRILEEER